MARSLLDMKAEILKALGHSTRLAIVELLGAHGETCVCEIAGMIPSSGDRTTISKHLAILKSSGVLSDRKEGLRVFYRLNCPCVSRFLSCIHQMLEQCVREESAALKRTRGHSHAMSRRLSL